MVVEHLTVFKFSHAQTEFLSQYILIPRYLPSTFAIFDIYWTAGRISVRVDG
jgi:hypothetical protein